MRTNIDINDKLMSDTLKASGAKTKKEAVEFSMEFFLRAMRRQDFRKLRGKVDWKGDLEKMRTDK